MSDLSRIIVQVTNPETPFGGVQVLNGGNGDGGGGPLGPEGPDIPLDEEGIAALSPVTSVFGRIGEILALVSDYNEFYALLEAAVPPGGTADQVLAKINNNDYALQWVSPSSTGNVASVFGRTGTVSAFPTDYAAFYQPLDGDLTSIAALVTTSFGRGFLPLADAASARAYIGVTAGGGGGGGTGTVVITALVSGQPYIDVVFGTAQPDATWELAVCQVVNTLDVAALNIWPGIMSAKTTSGFRLHLNGAPDSANYFLHWALAGTDAAGASDFLALTDTPDSYTGQAGKVARVNSGESALEFVTVTGGGGSDTTPPTVPGSFTAEPIA